MVPTASFGMHKKCFMPDTSGNIPDNHKGLVQTISLRVTSIQEPCHSSRAGEHYWLLPPHCSPCIVLALLPPAHQGSPCPVGFMSANGCYNRCDTTCLCVRTVPPCGRITHPSLTVILAGFVSRHSQGLRIKPSKDTRCNTEPVGFVLVAWLIACCFI